MPRKKPTTLHPKAIEVWMEYYKKTTNEKYLFSGAKDGTAMKQLLKKVQSKMKDRSIEITDENTLNSLSGFLKSVSDRWVLDNLDLAIVNSKFNQLYVRAVSKNPFGRAEQIRETIRARQESGTKSAAG